MPLMALESPPLPLTTAASLVAAAHVGCPWRGLGILPPPEGTLQPSAFVALGGLLFVPENPRNLTTCAALHAPAFP